MTALATIGPGHNSGTPAEIVAGIREELRLWLVEHPVLSTDDEAREAARLFRRGKNTLDDIDADRKKLTSPLNAQVKEINAAYGEASAPLALTLDAIRARMTDWAEAEELRRQEIAEQARQEFLAAQDTAIEAMRAAQEAEDDAALGVTADVVSAAQAVSLANAEAKKAERDYLRAERDAEHVRLAPGLGARSMSLRSRTELIVTDAALAIGAMGLTEGIAEAILTSARAYKKLKGHFPPGIAVNTTRSV